MDHFSKIEKKWQQYWAANKTYAADERSARPKFYVLDMFPYPSGAGLHVGHPLGYIASDIYARFKRHEGFNVLHPMGFDSFGLPAEQYAIQTGRHPALTTEKNIKRYREQLDQLGFSFDWQREVRTSDPKFYRWTQWIFIRLFDSWYDHQADKARPVSDLKNHFEKSGTEGLSATPRRGETLNFTAAEWKAMSEAQQSEVLLNYRLAYRSKSMVNWCPALGTVLANDEVKDGVSERGGHPVIRKKMMQWSMRISAYAQRLLDGLETIDWSESLKETQRNWIGRSEGASIGFAVQNHEEHIEVFSTRPDTIFGATFMVLAPEHELVGSITTNEQRNAVEAYVERAARRSERDRMSDTKTISGVFTGTYAVHPFTRQPMPIWIADYVLAGYGTGAVMAVPGHDARDHAFAQYFKLPVVQVISSDDVQEAAIEAKEGTLMNSDFLDGLQVPEAIAKAIAAIEEKDIGKGQINYRLRDAVFGRQRYWGEPIPVYYENGIPKTLPEDQLPLTLPEVDKYLPTEDGEPPLARAENWRTEDGHPMETTTMPGWAGSSWYFLRYMDPDNTGVFANPEKIKYWENVDLYVGGSEHATGHLLYARFWHKFLADRGWVYTQEPFKKLVNQGMIQGVSAIIHRLILPEYWNKNLKEKYRDRPIYFGQGAMGELDSPFDLVQKLERQFNEWLFKTPEQNYPDQRVGSHYIQTGIRIPIDFVDEHSNEISIEKLRRFSQDFENAIYVDEHKFIAFREVEKMSKRWHNVVNPDEVVAQYGADVLRMYEMFLGPVEQSKPWDTKGITGVSNFLRKLVRLYDHPAQVEPSEKELRALHKCIKKVREDIENFSFNTAVSAFMICVNELTELKTSSRSILEPLVVLLSPFAPHTAEELWAQLGHEPSVTQQPYPTFNETYLVESTIDYPVQFNGKTRFNVIVPADLDRKGIEAQVLADTRSAKWLEGVQIRKIIVVPGRIVNVVVS